MKINGILAEDREAIIAEAKRVYGKPHCGYKVHVLVLSMSPGVCGANEGKYFGNVEIIEVANNVLHRRGDGFPADRGDRDGQPAAAASEQGFLASPSNKVTCDQAHSPRGTSLGVFLLR